MDCEDLTANESREMGVRNFHYVDHKYGVQNQMTSPSKRDLPFSFIDYDTSQLERIYCSLLIQFYCCCFLPFFLIYIILLLIFKISKSLTQVI